jgi:hypothetical protein
MIEATEEKIRIRIRIRTCGKDPRIRIRIKTSWIRNIGEENTVSESKVKASFTVGLKGDMTHTPL